MDSYLGTPTNNSLKPGGKVFSVSDSLNISVKADT